MSSPTPVFDLYDEVTTELHRARSKFAPFNSAHEGYAVILEELDELWLEVKANPPDVAQMREEAIQVAAMAMRFVLDVCRESVTNEVTE